MQRLWLISYDIADDRRRRALDRLLHPLGERVLESLWECWLAAEQARALREELLARLDPAQDRLALIPVCADCQRRVRDVGLGRPGGQTACAWHAGVRGLPQTSAPSPTATPGLARGRARPYVWLI